MRGITFIDVLVGTALMLIVFLGIFGAYQLGLKIVGQSKARITATAIANQQIEMIRNLPYKSVGIKGGYPDGDIEETRSITRNNVQYIVANRIDYNNDPFDGIAEDPCPNDYKKVKVKVSWVGRFGGGVSLTTDVAPKGIAQECAQIGGTLFVSVFDANGLPISGANVDMVDIVSGLTKNCITFDEGNCLFVLPESIETYQITASKSGYSTDRTYSEEELDSPAKPHASVYEGELTEIGFSIDKVSIFLLQTTGTQAQGYPPVKEVPLDVQGVKIIGTDSDGNPIYKYSESFLTGSAGKLEINNLEWDSYSFSVDKQTTGLDLIEIEAPPRSTTTQPIDLLPDSTQEVRLILKAENTLLVTVQDASTTEPIFGVSCNLSNIELEYDRTQPTDTEGKTFFIPLEEAIYQLVVEVDGYASSTDSLSVSDDTTSTINLIPVP